MKQQKQNKGSKTKVGGFFNTALFVAFKNAIQPMQTNQHTTEKDVYFDFENQHFVIEPKGRVSLTKGFFLFTTVSKDAFNAFYNSVFTPLFKETGKPVTKSQIEFCKNQWKVKTNFKTAN